MSDDRRVVLSITIHKHLLQRIRATAKDYEMSVSRVIENVLRNAYDEEDKKNAKGGGKRAKKK